MHNICIFTLPRTSCENFLLWSSMKRWSFNTYDLMYDRTDASTILKTRPHEQHICKVYIESVFNPKTKNFIDEYLKDYICVHFYRSNKLKHYLTKRMQDNLIGEYGKEYKTFSYNAEDHVDYTEKNITLTDKFLKEFKDYKFINYDVDKALLGNHQELSPYIGNPTSTFEDTFDIDICKKIVKNLDFSRIA